MIEWCVFIGAVLFLLIGVGALITGKFEQFEKDKKDDYIAGSALIIIAVAALTMLAVR